MRCRQTFCILFCVLLVLGLLTCVGQAEVIRWDFNTDSVMPDTEVPGADHFTLNGTGTETVSGGQWSLDTSSATNIYNRYAIGLPITDYGEALVRVKVLGPTTDNGLGSTFGMLDSTGERSTFSVNQSGVKVNQGDGATIPTTPVANMGSFHTFRLIYDKIHPAGEQTMLYDGTTRVRSTTPINKSPSALNVSYGDVSNAGSANMAVDFVEFTNTPPRNLTWDFDVDGVDPRDEEPGTLRAVTGSPTTSTVAGGIYRIDTGATSNNLSFRRRMEIDDDFAQAMVWMKDEGTTSHGGHAGFRFMVDQGATYDRSQFAIRDGQVQINETGASHTGPTSDRYHLYHLIHDGTAASGQQTRLYKDGILVASGNPQVKGASVPDSFSFGDATGSGQADWSVDFVRASSDRGAMILPYEHYWAPDALPEDSDPAWALVDNGPPDSRTLFPGSHLNIDTPATGGNGSHADAYSANSMYGQPDIVDCTKPLTVDFTMRVNGISEGSYVNALTFYEPEGSNTRYYVHTFDVDDVAGQGGSFSLDTSVFHDYRLTLDPNANQTKLYIDDVLALTNSSSGLISGFSRNGFYWGDSSNSRAGNTDWAFVGWSNMGAFDPAVVDLAVVPEPSAICLGLLGAGLLTLGGGRRRRKSNP